MVSILKTMLALALLAFVGGVAYVMDQTRSAECAAGQTSTAERPCVQSTFPPRMK